MGNVNVSMRLTQKQAGALYVKSMRLEDEVKSLTAKIEQLHQLSAELLNQCEGLNRSPEIWKATGFAFGNINYQDAAENLAVCINKKPAKCLAEIKAQAVMDAANECCAPNPKNLTLTASFASLINYANKLRQAAKGGE